jgi:hypothetical protein
VGNLGDVGMDLPLIQSEIEPRDRCSGIHSATPATLGICERRSSLASSDSSE